MILISVKGLFFDLYLLELPSCPLTMIDKRPNSFSIEDAFFGDSGKGAVVAKINHALVAKNPNYNLFSLRYNGGANAGHETHYQGKVVVTNQLPTAVIEEGATGIISRGMVLNPESLICEIDRIKKLFGGQLPGKLLIDQNVPLTLNTHQAKETVDKRYHCGNKGSTGRGIAPAYGSFYERYPVFLRELLDENWKKNLSDHYHYYDTLIKGFGNDLREIAGTKKVFLEKLDEVREQIRPFAISNMQSLLEKVWKDSCYPFTIEGAQGIGLDPYHGVYPDITASRPASRNIADATYAVILPEEIEYRLAVMKTTYMSSVGSRKLPTLNDPEWQKWTEKVQKTFDETGRTTGRKRDILSISIPMGKYFKRAAGFDYLVATHLDASWENENIRVITRYNNKETGRERPYLPFQNELDKLEPHALEFSGWNGEAVKKIRDPKKLPLTAQRYLAYLGQEIAPIAMTTTGPDLDEYISFLPYL